MALRLGRPAAPRPPRSLCVSLSLRPRASHVLFIWLFARSCAQIPRWMGEAEGSDVHVCVHVCTRVSL